MTKKKAPALTLRQRGQCNDDTFVNYGGERYEIVWWTEDSAEYVQVWDGGRIVIEDICGHLQDCTPGQILAICDDSGLLEPQQEEVAHDHS